MKLISYCRISTANQDKGYSLEEQEKSILLYSQLYEHEIVNTKNDRATGIKKNSGLNEVMELILKDDSIQGVIVDKLDRLFRNTEELLKTIRELKEKKKTLISVKEQFDVSTPIGEMCITIIGSVAQFERSRIQERLSTGRKAKKEQGSFTGGTVPLGYKLETIRNPEGKSLKILKEDSQEQNLIQIIRNHRRSGKSFGKIAKYLNEQGYKTKKNKLFTATQIFNIVKCLKEQRVI
jgi:site-specific DNA recombinase